MHEDSEDEDCLDIFGQEDDYCCSTEDTVVEKESPPNLNEESPPIRTQSEAKRTRSGNPEPGNFPFIIIQKGMMFILISLTERGLCFNLIRTGFCPSYHSSTRRCEYEHSFNHSQIFNYLRCLLREKNFRMAKELLSQMTFPTSPYRADFLDDFGKACVALYINFIFSVIHYFIHHLRDVC